VGAGAGYKREAGEEGSVHRGVRPGQRGLTLVELMVTLAMSSIVIVAEVYF
jgi:prepilin-type N-terminal cleavage/methylation domain-containing protein